MKQTIISGNLNLFELDNIQKEKYTIYKLDEKLEKEILEKVVLKSGETIILYRVILGYEYVPGDGRYILWDSVIYFEGKYLLFNVCIDAIEFINNKVGNDKYKKYWKGQND